MKLINLTEMPPRGYQYYEPSLDWRVPNDLASQGLRMVAEALQRVRAQNPASGLDPSYEACVEAIGVYTCQRLAPWPKVQKHFCGGTPMTDQERYQQEAQERAVTSHGCAGCGRSR